MEVEGSSPTGGILSQMCVISLHVIHCAHSSHNLPSVGIEPGPMALQSGHLTRKQTSQSERTILGNPSSSKEAPFRTLIAANDAPFSASFQAPPSARIFTLNLDNP